MTPIDYETHCSACHPLPIGGGTERTIRHGRAAQSVIAELREFFAAQAVQTDPELLRKYVPPRRMPNPPDPGSADTLEDAVNAKVFAAARRLFGGYATPPGVASSHSGCLECHDLKPSAKEIFGIGSLSDLALEDVRTNPLWFSRARFDHRSHRALGCTDCHAAHSDPARTTTSTSCPASHHARAVIRLRVRPRAPAGPAPAA